MLQHPLIFFEQFLPHFQGYAMEMLWEVCEDVIKDLTYKKNAVSSFLVRFSLILYVYIPIFKAKLA